MPVPTHKRRNRSKLSCDRCRKMKRKCNRESPCMACRVSKNACIWSSNDRPNLSEEVSSSTKEAGPTSSQETSPPSLSPFGRSLTSVPTLTSFQSGSEEHHALLQRPTASRWNSNGNGKNEEDLKAIWNLPGLANVVVTIFFRDLDYMYDILGDSQSEREWRSSPDGCFDGGFYSYRYGPILLAVCAIACQIYSCDVEAAILLQSGELADAAWLGECCWKEARLRIDREYTIEKDGFPPLEYFQASLLCHAYIKNTGDRGSYRDYIFRDISRLQRQGLHRQRSDYASAEEEALANRIFWAYFAYDRFYFMLDGLPYCMGSQHADIWMQDSRGVRVHVQDLCNGYTGNGIADASAAPHMSLSILAASNVKLAALLGRYTDCIYSLKNMLGNGHNSSMLSEQVASQSAQELSMMEQEIRQHVYSQEMPHLYGLSDRVKTLRQGQQHMLSMTVAKIKSNIASGLIRDMSRASLLSPTLHHQKLDLASKLLQLALTVAAKMPIRQMAWGFFLFYTYEPIMELLESLSQSDNFMTTSPEQLSYVLSGRNLLVMIARETKLKVARDLAKKICVCSAESLAQFLGIDRVLIDTVKDDNVIVKVQKVVDAFRECILNKSLQSDINTALLSMEEASNDAYNSAMMQALEGLLSQMANPVLVGAMPGIA